MMLFICILVGMLPATAWATEEPTPQPNAGGMTKTEAAGTNTDPKAGREDTEEIRAPLADRSAAEALPVEHFSAVANVRLDSYDQFLAYYYLTDSTFYLYMEDGKLPHHQFVTKL